VKERELIDWIRGRTPVSPHVLVGIGDDAAVLETEGRLVVTTDTLVEGTHFATGDPPVAVGRKTIAVSLSDVAAMGCRPVAAFLAVALRAEQSGAFAQGVLEGALDIAREFDVPLAGGDTTGTTGPAVLTSTLLGTAPVGRQPVLRSGAKPGEKLLVTGALGGSRAGRHLSFVPRLREARELVSTARPGGMIDLSDGLSTDAWHLAEESRVLIHLFADRIPVSPEAAGLGSALDDGEDFELLFTLPASMARLVQETGLAGTPVTIIGDVLEGGPSVRIVDEEGGERELAPGGYEHFA
jgi:thiamine-monophosphate kinase